jgi:hypothetical protein
LADIEFNKVHGSKNMANFTNFSRIVTAAVGALVISTACIAAATGPAFAVEQGAPVYAAANQASVQVNA